MEKSRKIRAKGSNLFLKVSKGHFATGHSHLSYYIDVTDLKFQLSQAKAIAEVLGGYYAANTLIDTILCIDGTEVIGACLAEYLTEQGRGVNAGAEIAVVTPEHATGSQLIFRDNTSPMIQAKHVLILGVSVATGYTMSSAIEAVRYYQGMVVGAAAIFAMDKSCSGIPVTSVFNPNDLPGYASYAAYDCPLCKAGMKLDGLINIHGFSAL